MKDNVAALLASDSRKTGKTGYSVSTFVNSGKCSSSRSSRSMTTGFTMEIVGFVWNK